MSKKFVLPNMDHKFSIQIIGEESGLNWAGDFLYRRPNLQERALIDVMRARLSGDLFSIDPDVRSYNEAVSHLRFTLKEFPEWWKDTDFGGQLYDANVIIHIYGKCIEFEAEWKSKVHGGVAQDVSTEKPVGASA